MADKRRFAWYRQSKERGFDDRETWCLHMTIAKFALPRLKRFKEVGCEYPMDLTSEKWDKILDDIIYAMEISADDHKWYLDTTDDKRVNRGCKLFGQYFFNLWW